MLLLIKGNENSDIAKIMENHTPCILFTLKDSYLSQPPKEKNVKAINMPLLNGGNPISQRNSNNRVNTLCLLIKYIKGEAIIRIIRFLTYHKGPSIGLEPPRPGTSITQKDLKKSTILKL